MNLQKTILSLLFFIITSVTAFAQNDIDSRVNDFIKQANIQLTENNKSLKFSKEQETKAREIYKSLVLLLDEEPKSKKKKEAYKEAIKPKLIEIVQSIKGLLTPEQLKAFESYQTK